MATADGRDDGTDGADSLIDWQVGDIQLPGFAGWQRQRDAGMVRSILAPSLR